jgi:hypothetical protein
MVPEAPNSAVRFTDSSSVPSNELLGYFHDVRVADFQEGRTPRAAKLATVILRQLWTFARNRHCGLA